MMFSTIPKKRLHNTYLHSEDKPGSVLDLEVFVAVGSIILLLVTNPCIGAACIDQEIACNTADSDTGGIGNL
jgi:hypothetical protein